MSHLSVGRYFPASAPGQIQNEAPKTGVDNSTNAQPGQAVPRLSDASSRLQTMLGNCVKLEGGVLLLQRTALQKTLKDAGFNPSPGNQLTAQKELIAAGDKVASAMQALDKLGCAAFMVASPSEQAKKALDDVISTLMDLEEATDKMANSIADDAPNAGRVHTALEGLRNACASRVSETVTLTSALRVLGTNPDQLAETSFALKAADLENKSLTQFMGEMALKMHGIDNTLQNLSDDAEHLFARADQLEKNNATVSLTAFQAEATSLKQELGELRSKAGALSDSAELATLNVALERMEAKLTSLCTDKGTQAIQNMARVMLTPWPDEPLKTHKNPNYSKFLITLESAVASVGDRLQQALQKNDNGILLDECLIELDTLRARLTRDKQDILDSMMDKNRHHFNSLELLEFGESCDKMLSGHVLGCDEDVYMLEKKQLREAYQRAHNKSDTLHMDLLSTVLTSPHVGVPTLVEAQVRGIPARYLELGTNDAMLSESKVIGSGICNTVQLCTYQDTQSTYQRIFKPEMEGARGVPNMLLANTMKVNYAKTQLAELNIASCIVADTIGCGNVLAKSTIGLHRGTFGLFMENAPGMSAGDFANSNALKALKSPNGNNELYWKACGNLQRELNKLEWADLLSGQTDRHRNNYFVDLNSETGDVKVTGIDNDMAFPHISILAGTAMLTRQQVRQFAPRLVTISTSFEVKLDELSGKELAKARELMGFNQVNKPAYIDASVFDKLMAVDEQAYENQLRECLHDTKAAKVAVDRLKAAKSLATMLHANNKVMDDKAWSKSTMLDEARTTYTNTIAGNESVRLITKGFFVRDMVKNMV